MIGAKSKYLFSPTTTLFIETPKTHVITDSVEKIYEDYGKSRFEKDPDLLPHSAMSWANLDHVMPYEYTHPETSLYEDSSSSSTTSSSSSSSQDDDAPSFVPAEEVHYVEEFAWRNYGLDLNLWNDENAPAVKIQKIKEMMFNDLEFSGFLTDRIIGAAASFLAESPENHQFVFHKCILKDKCLADISILRYHRYLRYIDLSYNFLDDLSPLGGIPYLMYLNVSHNRMKDTLSFTPAPWCLSHVNLSFNYISRITDLSHFWSIIHLDLSHNAIETIDGLQNLKYLKYLNLSYNLIEVIENLDPLNIEELNLESNCIRSFKSANFSSGSNILPYLRKIFLAYNRLSSLDFVKDLYNLRIIDLKFNKVNDLLEVGHFNTLITEIDLTGNDCTKWPNYKSVVLYSLPNLKIIDNTQVTISDKVAATTLFKAPQDLTAARTIAKLILLEQLNVPKIDSHVLPYDEMYPPLIILTGPAAVKKIALALHVAQRYPKKIKYCQWYTTKSLEGSETELLSYVTVGREDFNDMTRRGDFLAMQEVLGFSYGFHHDQISTLISEKKVGIAQMDLHATIQMSKRYPNVKLVLVITNDEQLHRRWIEDKFCIYMSQKDSVPLLVVKEASKLDSEAIFKDNSFNFIKDLLDDIIENMEFANRISFLVSRKATDSTKQNEISVTPSVIIKRSFASMKAKNVKFQKPSQDLNVLDLFSAEKEKTKALRVIMDEDLNIIVEDEKTKMKRKKVSLLYKRSEFEFIQNLSPDDLNDSLSSEEEDFKSFVNMKDPVYERSVYTDFVISTRKMYLDYHRDNPGFFSKVLLTDDFTKSYNSLNIFIFEIYVNHSWAKFKYLTKMDLCVRSAIPKMANTVLEEIRESLSMSKVQIKTAQRLIGVSSWKDLMPSQMSENLNPVGSLK